MRRDNVENVHVINIRKVEGAAGLPAVSQAEVIAAAAPDPNPEAVAIVMGNEHAALGLFEHPVPFALGHKDGGSIPQDATGRFFIPYEVLKSHFKQRMPSMLISSIFDKFPDADKYIINVPPPVGDWDHISKNFGRFGERVKLGPSPKGMHRHIYDIQATVLREIGEDVGAGFIEVDPETETEEGCLQPKFYNQDPTHGNFNYGRVMMRKVIGDVGGAA